MTRVSVLITNFRRGNPVYYDTKLLRAFAGDHDRNAYEEGEQGREVESILMHPQYTTTGTRNDIALVKLVKPFKFSDTIRPACLPKQDEELPVGKKCAATGWGRIESKPYLGSLRQTFRLGNGRFFRQEGWHVANSEAGHR